MDSKIDRPLDRNRAVAQIVQHTFASFFGEDAAAQILRHIERHRLPQEEIGERYDEFRKLLEEVFGKTSVILTRQLDAKISGLFDEVDSEAAKNGI